MTAVKVRVRIVFAVGFVVAATAIGLVVSANNAGASVLLLLAVALAALFGRASGAIAAVTGAASLNYFFTAPEHTLTVTKPADLFALAAFVVVAAFVGTLVARVTELRRRAELGEREARIRLDLTQRLFAGEDPATAVAAAAQAVRQLFGFSWCMLTVGELSASTGDAHAHGERIHVEGGYGIVDAIAPQLLVGEQRAVLEALLANLGTSVERLRLEDVAREARIAAEVGRTRSGFLSTVSHNLRTPLAAIKAAVSTLRAPDLDLAREDRRDLLDTIHEEVDRLERLVTKVLDLSRIRTGGLEFAPEQAELADIARAAIRRVRPLMRAHTIRLDFPDELKPMALDVTMMEQVFLNLLENAIRFAPPGSEIRVSAREAAGFLEVRVADRGRGVPPEHRDRIFDEFYRVDAQQESTGTGLGLAIVKAMIGMHGGSVFYDDAPGGGAVVGFRLPLDTA